MQSSPFAITEMTAPRGLVLLSEIAFTDLLFPALHLFTQDPRHFIISHHILFIDSLPGESSV